MNKITTEIKRLEQEIAQNWQNVHMQSQQIKMQINHKIASIITSPPIFMLAFTGGALISKKLKRGFKQRPANLKIPRDKLSLLQKLMALSSEAALALKLFNHVKPVLAHLMQKAKTGMTITKQQGSNPA